MGVQHPVGHVQNFQKRDVFFVGEVDFHGFVFDWVNRDYHPA